MEKYSSESEPDISESRQFRIVRDVIEMNEIKWTVEHLEGVLAPGQKEIKEIPGDNEWNEAFFEEMLIDEHPKPTLKITWLYKYGLMSNLLITPGIAESSNVPSNSHIELRLTPLMATVPDLSGQPGAQVSLSVEITFGDFDAYREYTFNGHGAYQIIEYRNR